MSWYSLAARLKEPLADSPGRNNRHLIENLRLVELCFAADAGARPEDHPLMFDRARVLQGDGDILPCFDRQTAGLRVVVTSSG